MEAFLDKKLVFKTDFSEPNTIDSSAKRKSYLIVTETGKHLSVSPTSYFLLESISNGNSVEQVANTLNVSVKKIISSYEVLAAKIEELDNQETNRRKGFWFLLEFIPSNIVNSIAKPLSVMFLPLVAWLCCFLILTGIVLSIQVGVFSGFDSIQNPHVFWLGYLLFFFSTIAHEFGHASASVRYGVSPSGIGFTIYLIFPALYSDVTSSWKLKSRQRVIVGLGGIYFQLICAAVYIFCGIAFGNDAFKIATLMIFANCILNLNPFFKFDGYWILSDLFGVVNLSEQPKQIFSFIWARLQGDKSVNLPWKTRTSFFVGLYAVGSILLIVFLVSIYSSYLLNGIMQYPITLQQFLSKVFVSGTVSFAEIHTFFLSTAFLIVLAYFLYNIVIKRLANRIFRSAV